MPASSWSPACPSQSALSAALRQRIAIGELAHLIAEKTGFRGELKFNQDMPDGQPRRCLDVTRAKELLGFEAKTTLAAGLEKTINWYLASRKAAAAA